MKKITAYQTADGSIYTSYEQALRHEENKYGNLLTSLARRAVAINKYSEMMDFLAENLYELAELKVLLDACTLEPDDEDD